MKTAKDILIGTKQVIGQLGWGQGRYQDDTGRVCIIGAIRIADNGNAYVPGSYAYSNALDAINRVIGEIVSWNDAPGRTQDEVIAVLDNALNDNALNELRDEVSREIMPLF